MECAINGNAIPHSSQFDPLTTDKAATSKHALRRESFERIYADFIRWVFTSPFRIASQLFVHSEDVLVPCNSRVVLLKYQVRSQCRFHS